jgi:hypothetical protein
MDRVTEHLLRLDQLAKAPNLPRSLLAQVPPTRPARGRYVALYSLADAREYLRRQGIAFAADGALTT